MAAINSCKYCGGGILNGYFHDKCKIIFLEDLLYSVQIFLKEGKEISGEIKRKISEENFLSQREFFEKKGKEKEKRRKKEIWEEEKREAFSNFSQNWEEKNLDPDPVQF
ncbi:MAG: hypothetical protein V1910_01290 [bacterium]